MAELSIVADAISILSAAVSIVMFVRTKRLAELLGNKVLVDSVMRELEKFLSFSADGRTPPDALARRLASVRGALSAATLALPQGCHDIARTIINDLQANKLTHLNLDSYNTHRAAIAELDSFLRAKRLVPWMEPK